VDANGKTVVAYTVEDKYLVCLDPERDDQWSVRTGDDLDGTLVGAPEPIGAGKWAVTDLGGRVTIFDSANEKFVGSATIGLRYKFTDETFLALANAMVPDVLLAKLTQLKLREWSLEDLQKEIARVLNPDEQERWKRVISNYAAIGLAGAVPVAASSPLGNSALLILLTDGSAVVVPMPEVAAPVPEPKAKE
jgi:hypothetical protein